MKYSEAKQGRIFVIRLEDGETVHEEIERFAIEHAVSAAAMIIIGGADEASRLVVGPESGHVKPVIPMEHVLDSVHEVAGTGTLFPDEEGRPLIHVHMACGRGSDSVTGCIRRGVKVWKVMEVILFELVDTTARRVLEADVGFKLLQT